MTQTTHPDVHTPWRTVVRGADPPRGRGLQQPGALDSRRVLMNDFRDHMRASANVVLHVGELAYGDRPFEVTGDDPNDVQLRTSHELWHKENILNLVVQRFPPGWRYGAVIDGDFHMTRRDWALEAIHQLQHYDLRTTLFQLLGPLLRASAVPRSCRVLRTTTSMERPIRTIATTLRAAAAKPYGYYGAQPGVGAAKGGGMAGGRDGRRVGFPAFGLRRRGRIARYVRSGVGGLAHGVRPGGSGGCGSGIEVVQQALRGLGSPVAGAGRGVEEKHRIRRQPRGALLSRIEDMARAYGSRWRILLDNNFDPRTDIARDWQGVYQLTGNKPRLRDQIRTYFRDRNEDSRQMAAQERHMV